eukprot:TRINITY_DN1202_c0_g1_i2.p1 TRINITY_DN1202_c0_g1~~TRINITY_DN1202_c0_g1_i2.p1  ORF type:complete len:757 (+),score=157.97 TRINITY_DN1202_c0_g1_i2:1059-3329(+)
MGFKGHIIDRITYSIKDQLKSTRSLEFWWNTNPSLGNASRVFTHILDDNYCEPMGEGFDFEGGATPVTPSNIRARAEQFVSLIRQRAPFYRTNNILLPWGCDFHFVNATKQFENMDQIVKYIQDHAAEYNVNLKYSLLSEYYEAAMGSGVVFPERDSNDFMPYADGPDAWWTGYYTSRVNLKGLIREAEHISRAADTLYATTPTANRNVSQPVAFDMLNISRYALGISQHHDAVSGTSKDFVAQDYRNWLELGSANAHTLSETLLNSLASKGGNAPSFSNFTTQALNLQPGKTLVVVVYNSLGWTRSEFVRVPLNRNDVTVTDSNGGKVAFEVHNAQGTSEGKYDLFIGTTIKALGFQTYFVTAGAVNSKPVDTPLINEVGDYVLENSYLRVTVSSTTGTISSIQNKKSGISNTLNHNVLAYHSYTGSGQRSGAYIFRTTGPAQPLSSRAPTNTPQGQIVQSLYQVFPGDTAQSYYKQNIRLYNAGGDENFENFIDISHEIGVIPEDHEVISRFSSNIQTGGVIYTDNNGFATQKRTYDSTLPIPANYYPNVYWSYIEDSNARLSIASERSHGVSSQAPGSVEFMLHRRTSSDDSRGVDEPLDDTDITHPVLRLVYETPANSDLLRYKQVYSVNFPLSLYYATANSPSDWTSRYQTSYSPLSGDLPPNVHLLSLKTRDSKSNTLILRLTHLFAADEKPANLAAPAVVDLKALFSGYTIGNLVETTLTINQVVNSNPGLTITLGPKQIRTFLLTLSK